MANPRNANAWSIDQLWTKKENISDRKNTYSVVSGWNGVSACCPYDNEQNASHHKRKQPGWIHAAKHIAVHCQQKKFTKCSQEKHRESHKIIKEVHTCCGKDEEHWWRNAVCENEIATPVVVVLLGIDNRNREAESDHDRSLRHSYTKNVCMLNWEIILEGIKSNKRTLMTS